MPHRDVVGRAEVEQIGVEAEHLARCERGSRREVGSDPQQWKVPTGSSSWAIVCIIRPHSLARLGVATLLMSGASQTVKRRPADRASTIDAAR